MAKKAFLLLTASLLFAGLSLHAATITINTNNSRQAISPLIYGTDQQMEGDENLTVMRLGGNRMTGYNWENNASNAGNDWYNSSDDYMCSAIEFPLSATECASSSGGVLDHWVDYCNTRNYKSIITLPMAGYVSADKNGTVSAGEAAPSARWKQVIAVKGSAFQDPPNTSDNYVYDDEEVYHLVHKYGNASTATGVMAYQLDNEADIWSGTHPLIHPTPVGSYELVARSVTLSAAIKNVDPNAQVFGPVFAMIWSEDAVGNTLEWNPIKAAGGYNWYVDYYLDQMSKASVTKGKRLLDAIDIHYYSEQREGLAPPFNYSSGQCRITDGSCTTTAAALARLQSPRTLWDATYVENSSVGQWLTGDLPLLPKLQSSINKYYPGTKIAVTEHGFGGGSDYSGGLAIADVLGIFGKYGVYVATMWKTGYGLFHSAAYKLYRNYNGSNGTYGSTMVYCESNDVPNMTCYASIEGNDDSILHIIVINKASTAQTAAVNITSPRAYSLSEAWGFGGASSAVASKTAPVVSSNAFSYSMPAHTAYHFILKIPPTPTATQTYSRTATPTSTPTFTRTPTGTVSSTATGTYTATSTFTFTAAATDTYSMTATRSFTATATPSFTRTATQTVTQTYTKTATMTVTLTVTHTSTKTITETATESPVCSPTETITGTPPTFTQTVTFTQTPADTVTFTETPVDTVTFTETPQNTKTLTETPVNTGTPTTVNTSTFSPTFTRTRTSTPIITQTFTKTYTLTPTKTMTATMAPTATITPTQGNNIPEGVIYPNPYNPKSSDLNIAYNLRNAAKTIKFMIYTPSLRLVRSETWSNKPAGLNQGKVDRKYLVDLSNGTYLYVVTYGENGNENKSKIGLFVLLK